MAGALCIGGQTPQGGRLWTLGPSGVLLLNHRLEEHQVTRFAVVAHLLRVTSYGESLEILQDVQPCFTLVFDGLRAGFYSLLTHLETC